MNGKFPRRFSAVVVLACVALSASVCTAQLLSISDGVTSMVITDGFAGDSLALGGAVLYIGSVGANWYDVTITGITKPFGGSATAPELDLNVSATSLGAGTLTILWSDNFFGPTAGTVTAGVGGNAAGTVVYSTFAGPGNGFFAQTTLLTSQGPFTPVAFDGTAYGALALPASYSLTQNAIITHTGGGTSGFDASVAIPEPGTLALCMIGLAGLFVARRRRSL